MEDSAMSQPMTWPHIGYTYLPRVRGVISMALKVNTPCNHRHFRSHSAALMSRFVLYFVYFFNNQILCFPVKRQNRWLEWMKRGDFPEDLHHPRLPSTPPHTPPGVCLRSSAYQADERREEHPAELPPAAWPVADHVLDVLVKPLGSWRHAQIPVRWELIGRSLITRQAGQTNVISCCCEGVRAWFDNSSCKVFL